MTGDTVALLADAPTLTTGFAATTRHMAEALSACGYRVRCYGIKARPGDVPAGLGYEIWPAEQGGHWSATLPEFFATARPDALILNMDVFNAVECLELCWAADWRGPTISYVCFDGLPIDAAYLRAQRCCDAVWATSCAGADYLTSQGVAVVGIAPPGVDLAEFRPHADPSALRARAGLPGATIVGVFATNTERKQLPRAMAGFARCAERLPEADLRLYLHCRQQGYWDLTGLARDLKISDRVLFAAGDFDEFRGLAPLSYVQRMNLCHVVVNVPHSGDVEQAIIEAQACGIPLITTDDDGVMAHAAGPAGYKLTGTVRAEGRAGQRLVYVDPEHVADALLAILTDEQRQARMRAAGLANAALFPWSVLERAACAMIEPYVRPLPSE